MLSLLLDEHISPKIGKQLLKKRRDIRVRTLQTWEQGSYLELDDELLLELAQKESLTLVTYDLRTIPTLLVQRAERGLNHAGVIFIDQKTIPPNNFGLLIKSLVQLWDVEQDRNWENRVIFLQAP